MSASNIIFIPKELDDAGLDVYEVRVLVTLARRCGDNGAWPSVKTIAKTCRMSEKTVGRALRVLKEGGFVEEEQRPGRTTVYWITKATKWITPKTIDTPPAGGPPPPEEGGNAREGDPTHARGGDPPPVRGDEGTPRKVPHEDIAEVSGETPAPPLVPEQPDSRQARKKPARRNVAFDALAELDGAATGSMTPAEGGRIGKALADIREAHAEKLPDSPTPEQRQAYETELAAEIRRRAARYRGEVMPFANLTATALAAHWSKCGPPRSAGIGQPLAGHGGRFALPDGLDWRAIARELGLRIAFDTPWHEVSHAMRADILQAGKTS